MDYKYNAFVLGKREIGETDRVYIFLTAENGKVRAIGRGTKKSIAKLAGNLETLNQVEVFISKSKGLGNISGVIPVKVFLKLRENLEILGKILEIFKILEKIVPEEQPEQKIYELLDNFLSLAENSIQEKKNLDFQFLKASFLVKIFEELGYRLEAEKCVECGGKLFPSQSRFDFSRGGIICQECVKNQGGNFSVVSDNVIKAIRLILANKLENLIKLRLGEKEKKELELLVENFYRWTWG